MNEQPETQKDEKSFWDVKELLKLALIAFIIVVPFRLFIAQPFIVDGASMYPTFKNADYLIVNELSYHFTTPVRGSVLVFHYPKDPSKSFIKRVIGLPGEIVTVKNGVVTITNNENPTGLVLDEPYVKLPCNDLKQAENRCISNTSFTLSSDEYYVMGDNRAESADSRIWGPVPKMDIIGRPVLRVVPFNFSPGDYSSSYRNL